MVRLDFMNGHIELDNQIAAKMMKVTRVEVIDENGRSYTKFNTQGYLNFQDDGRTLKVFLSPRD